MGSSCPPAALVRSDTLRPPMASGPVDACGDGCDGCDGFSHMGRRLHSAVLCRSGRASALMGADECPAGAGRLPRFRGRPARRSIRRLAWLAVIARRALAAAPSRFQRSRLVASAHAAVHRRIGFARRTHWVLRYAALRLHGSRSQARRARRSEAASKSPPLAHDVRSLTINRRKS